jgi:hypothetical protein
MPRQSAALKTVFQPKLSLPNDELVAEKLPGDRG